MTQFQIIDGVTPPAIRRQHQRLDYDALVTRIEAERAANPSLPLRTAIRRHLDANSTYLQADIKQLVRMLKQRANSAA